MNLSVLNCINLRLWVDPSEEYWAKIWLNINKHVGKPTTCWNPLKWRDNMTKYSYLLYLYVGMRYLLYLSVFHSFSAINPLPPVDFGWRYHCHTTYLTDFKRLPLKFPWESWERAFPNQGSHTTSISLGKNKHFVCWSYLYIHNSKGPLGVWRSFLGHMLSLPQKPAPRASPGEEYQNPSLVPKCLEHASSPQDVGK